MSRLHDDSCACPVINLPADSLHASLHWAKAGVPSFGITSYLLPILNSGAGGALLSILPLTLLSGFSLPSPASLLC